ncbi:hypothetical protein [Benzoatithermus flavus]|uniref:Uncharacterized protein n=1 Tax=Benzoatithermus flavus TaxID=3108223 RepID=A0ABU8XW63_9PROT
MKHKLMQAMARREAEKPEPQGGIALDDACLDGEHPGGECGREAAGEPPFVAAIETTPERKLRRIELVARAATRIAPHPCRDIAADARDGCSGMEMARTKPNPRSPERTQDGERQLSRELAMPCPPAAGARGVPAQQ